MNTGGLGLCENKFFSRLKNVTYIESVSTCGKNLMAVIQNLNERRYNIYN